jgi:hypothetical protein
MTARDDASFEADRDDHRATVMAGWCVRCGLHRVDDPRQAACPVCADDERRNHAAAVAAIGKPRRTHRNEETAP